LQDNVKIMLYDKYETVAGGVPPLSMRGGQGPHPMRGGKWPQTMRARLVCIHNTFGYRSVRYCHANFCLSF